MDIDRIVEKLGDFGLYQKKKYFIVCLPAIVSGLQGLIVIFILAIPNHRCQLDDHYNDTSFYPDNDVTKFYINLTIPVNNGQWSECERYQFNSSDFGENLTSYINLTKVRCNKWIYDTTVYESTFITQQNLVCDKTIYRSHANMLYMFGKMLGSIVFGFISDIFGRKKAFILAILFQIASAIGIVFSPNIAVFCVFRIITGATTSGTFISIFVIGMELVGKSKRAFAGLFIEFFYSAGLFLLLLLAYFFRDWKDLEIATAVSMTPFIFTYCFLPESTRWLISRGRTEEAKKIFREAARVNKVEIPETLFNKDCLEEEPKMKLIEMFTSPVLVSRSLIIFFNWMVISMVYYGLSLNITNLSGDVYVNFTISNTVEVIGYLLALLLTSRIGRRVVLCSSLLVGGISCVFTIFPVLYGEPTHFWITNGLSMVGKLGTSAAFGIIYLYSAELFPTVLRNSSIGLCSFMARIGSIVSPYISDLGELLKGDLKIALPLIIFGSSSVAAGLLALFLPETMNKPLPQTIEDAKLFGRKKETFSEERSNDRELEEKRALTT